MGRDVLLSLDQKTRKAKPITLELYLHDYFVMRHPL